MSIVGGLDVHRQQITFDYLDTETGEVSVGQIPSADRRQFAGWLARRFADRADRGQVEFSVEGCTGWRYVAEELAAAGMVAHLAEPAETANLRGRKKRAKTDRADARHQRDLLLAGRLPECWIPPTEVVEARALLGCYHDLRRDHTAWLQRIHAVLFHQGATACPQLNTSAGRAQLATVAAEQLSAAGRVQVAAAVLMLEATEAQMDILRRQLLTTAPAHARPSGARRAVVRGRADHRVGVDVLAGWGRPVLLGAEGGPVRRSGHHGVLLGGQAQPRAVVPAGPARVAVVSVRGRQDARPPVRAGPCVLRGGEEAGSTPKRAALSQARRLIRQAVHILTDLGDDAFAYV